jgi:hypothetical protein
MSKDSNDKAMSDYEVSGEVTIFISELNSST